MNRLLIATCIFLLAGCGGSSDTPSVIDGGNNGGQRPVTVTSQWTSLGTRSASTVPNEFITSVTEEGWPEYDPVPVYPLEVTETDHFITMDDGIRLSALVKRPVDANGNVVQERLPVILSLTTYNKDIGGVLPLFNANVPALLQHGYVHVIVDVRGTGRSDGEWEAFSEREQQDYSQVVDWVATQAWSNGNIGLHGVSAWAITISFTAAQQHPAVKALFLIVPMADAYRDIVAQGGQGNFMFLGGWLTAVTALSVVNPTFYESPDQYFAAAAAHALSAATNFQYPILANGLAGDEEIINDGPFWKLRSPIEQADRIQVPTFIVGGLHDVYQRGEPVLYEVLKRNTTTKLLMGPWDHLDAAVGAGLPTQGIPALDDIAVRWFDRYLKNVNNNAENLPNVTHWVWGADKYVFDADWPHPQAHAQRMYLGSDGGVSEQMPAADAPARIVLQQPFNGICSQSANQMTVGVMGLVPLPCFSDDRLANALELVYETAPLEEPMYFDGPIQADLWISSTARDTGVVVRVSDVAPDGTAFNLSNGMLQASLREIDTTKSRYLDGEMIQPWHPFTVESAMPLGVEPVEVAIEVWPTSAVIQPGHKLRIAVGPSNFPAGLPPVPTLLQSVAGLMSIYHDAEHPSSIVLPVVPAAALAGTD